MKRPGLPLLISLPKGKMEVKKITVGIFQTNCYLVKKGNSSFIIDPGDEGERIIEWIEEEGISPSFILNTHAHLDHIGAVKFLQERLRIPFYIHQEEKEILLNPGSNFFPLSSYSPLSPDGWLEEGNLKWKEGWIEILHTPGHTPGSICIRVENLLFTGDTLFKESVGRCDLPGGDEEKLRRSLERLKKLPDEWEVFPGHGPSSLLGEEKKNNPYLNGEIS